jgi:ParB family chromosome partitioning protein
MPETVKKLLFEGKITTGHAKCLGGLSDDEDKIFVAVKAAEEGMSVRETERFVKKFDKIKNLPEKKETEKRMPASEIIEAESKLTARLETKVKIVGTSEKGKIQIEYFSKEQLQQIYDYLLKK